MLTNRRTLDRLLIHFHCHSHSRMNLIHSTHTQDRTRLLLNSGNNVNNKKNNILLVLNQFTRRYLFTNEVLGMDRFLFIRDQINPNCKGKISIIYFH